MIVSALSRRLAGILCLWLASTLAVAAGLTIQDARIPEGPPVAPVLAGYLVIENPGDRPVRIVAASSPDFAAVEIHEMRMKDGMMEMKRLPELTVPAGGKVELAPGGLHLMLIKPGRPLRAGDQARVVLELDDGSHLELTLPVMGHDANGNGSHHQHAH